MRSFGWVLALAACGGPAGGGDDVPVVAGECEVGLEVGQCAPDFTLLDHEGVEVQLASRVGRALVVVGSSLWCTRCRSLVEGLQGHVEAEGLAGADVINVVVEGLRSDPATVQDAADWRSAYGLSFTVLADTEQRWVERWGGESARYNQHSYTVIGSDGRVSWRADGHEGTTLAALIEAWEGAE
jgi:peroxiredoxin